MGSFLKKSGMTEKEWFEKNPAPSHLRITVLTTSLGTKFQVYHAVKINNPRELTEEDKI